uniref:Uncharacterized protein n=1 Tax=Arundo donax TaxID=35708 RepID=A0A0A8ZQG2_ARUDO
MGQTKHKQRSTVSNHMQKNQIYSIKI